MPRGITQEQVVAAADTIVAAGERPTVEKVRAQLGTGSPNTVTRMLETWRQGLAERLREVNQLPGLPDAVGQVMATLWSQAVRHAREHVQHEVAAEREVLQHSRTALDARETERAALLRSTQEAKQKAEEAARRAIAETTALRRLADRLEAEAAEHATERTRLLAQDQALEAACSRLRDEARVAEAKSAKERTARDDHVKVIEDRAHAEVDRVRTELKTARAELTGVRKYHQAEIQALQRTGTELTRSLSAAEREAGHQRGVAEALKLKLSTAGHIQVGSPRKRLSKADPPGPPRQKSPRRHQ